MSEKFSRPEDVPHYGSFVEFVRVGRGVVFILDSDSTCCKLSIDPGRMKSSEAEKGKVELSDDHD